MSEIASFRDVVGLWRSPAAMASDIGASVAAARKWPQRDRIPDEWWTPIAESEVGRNAGVTIELLAGFAARRGLVGSPALVGAQP